LVDLSQGPSSPTTRRHNTRKALLNSRAWRPAALLLAGVCLACPTAVAAQARGSSSIDETQRQGAFPNASFDATFRKYIPPDNVFSPFYSWDAQMALNATVFRKTSSAVYVSSLFQTVGTENLGSKVSVGGTGYLLGFGYVRTYSDQFELSAGFTHLSSHLTRDLDDKLEEERNRGTTIPIVDDPSEYNVIFLKVYRKWSAYPFAPELAVIVEPVNFRLDGGPIGDVRPVYVGTRFTLWQVGQTSIVAKTQHEIGQRPFNDFSLSFEAYASNQSEGRLQVFISASPGNSMHVSPNIGSVRDGIALGVRMVFGA
jgi:hypothetical protein